MRRGALAAVALLLPLAACRTRPDLPAYGVVPDFTLTAQDGSLFRASEKLAGKVWIADFMFTNCLGPCPRMSARMHRLSQQFETRRDVRFVSITVDPDSDTPTVLAGYARRLHADTARWFFLTGSKETLQLLDRRTFLLGDIDGSLAHSTMFVLVDRQARIRGYYDSGEPARIQQLIDDVARVY